MSEFQYVMKQWRRMCEKNQADCMRFCPIYANPACGELTEASNEDIRKADDAIMAWAAEHPEPVYPTWREYLESIGVIVPRKNYTVMDAYALIIGQINTTRIPADIAEKLGIEPKEGKT